MFRFNTLSFEPLYLDRLQKSRVTQLNGVQKRCRNIWTLGQIQQGFKDISAIAIIFFLNLIGHLQNWIPKILLKIYTLKVSQCAKLTLFVVLKISSHRNR